MWIAKSFVIQLKIQSHQLQWDTLYMPAPEPPVITFEYLRRPFQWRRRRRQILSRIRRSRKGTIVTRVIQIMALLLPDMTILTAGWIRSLPAFIILLPAFVNSLHEVSFTCDIDGQQYIQPSNLVGRCMTGLQRRTSYRVGVCIRLV